MRGKPFKKGSIPWNKGKNPSYVQGKNNPNWKGGKPNCIDCGKKLSNYHNKRCRNCLLKFQKGENNPNWRNGATKAKCLDCGKSISKYHKRCKSCSRKKELSPHWKGGKLRCIDCGKRLSTSGSKNYIPQRCSKCWSKFNRGENNAQWKPHSELWKTIRRCPEYLQWVNAVLKRDNYTCQKCRSKKNKVVHHKKPFKKLLMEFLQKYNQFSPLEDKDTLLRLSWTYEPFWNLDIGQTLCESCHRKTHSKMNYESRVY